MKVRVKMLDRSPGNGTRYRLVLVAYGSELTVAWPDGKRSCGDFSIHNPPSAEWLRHSGGLRSKSDAQAISALVGQWCEEITAKEEAA